MANDEMAKIKVGISACLLGCQTRYDGAARPAPFLLDGLGGRVAWVPVCPEVEFGLPVPRGKITLRLGRDGGAPELWTLDGRRDLTAAMREFCRERARLLGRAGLAGFVFKGKSPSCGLGTAPLRRPGATADAAGDAPVGWADGFFAAAWRELYPASVVAEAETLAGEAAQAAFVARLRALAATGG